MKYDSQGRMVLNVEPNTSTGFNPDPNTPPSALKAYRYAYNDNGDNADCTTFDLNADGSIAAVARIDDVIDPADIPRPFMAQVNAEALLIASGQNLKRLLRKRGWGRRPWPWGAPAAVRGCSDEAAGLRVMSY